jgi:hydroxymethylbilane synthase
MVRIGTRASKLALWQANHVAAALRAVWPQLECELVTFVTQGDKVLDQPLPLIGGKGLFTTELEDALRVGAIDLAVHSLKDLPVEPVDGLVIGAILPREDARDVLVSREGLSLDTLPPQAVVGTSSRRREVQLLARRSDLVIHSIRGNVETRMRKVFEGEYDATVLALAGIKRLDLEGAVTQILEYEMMLPAPGQGALAVQCRSADAAIAELIGRVHDPITHLAVTAERLFLRHLGGGCSAPVAAHAIAQINGNTQELYISTMHLDNDGVPIRGSRQGRVGDLDHFILEHLHAIQPH